MESKRSGPLLQVWGWVNGRIAISVKRSYSQMIYGAWFPSPLWGAGLVSVIGDRVGSLKLTPD